MWTDLDTRWGLTRIMPKGPSQNVIARHIPKARRGERMKRVVIVAHYDTARASLAFSPGMVKQFPRHFHAHEGVHVRGSGVSACVALPIPVVPAVVDTYLWYASLVAAAYLLIPLLINVHRELAMPFVAGAGDNASGVAAMLGVFHNLVPEPDSSRFATSQFPPRGVRRSPKPRRRPASFRRARCSPTRLQAVATRPPSFRTTSLGRAGRAAVAAAAGGQARLPEFETIEFSAVVGERPPARPSRARPRAQLSTSDWADDAAEGLGATGSLGVASRPGRWIRTPERPPKRGILGGLGRAQEEGRERRREGLARRRRGVRRAQGRQGHRLVGQLRGDDDDDDDDGFGWKGGWAGDDPIEDEDFAANEAARIRRRVTEMVDRELIEKEVWFVATGAEEVGTVGMQAFLAAVRRGASRRAHHQHRQCRRRPALMGHRRGHGAPVPSERAPHRAGQARLARARDPRQAARVQGAFDRRDACARPRLQGDDAHGVRLSGRCR